MYPCQSWRGMQGSARGEVKWRALHNQSRAPGDNEPPRRVLVGFRVLLHTLMSPPNLREFFRGKIANVPAPGPVPVPTYSKSKS